MTGWELPRPRLPLRLKRPLNPKPETLSPHESTLSPRLRGLGFRVFRVRGLRFTVEGLRLRGSGIQPFCALWRYLSLRVCPYRTGLACELQGLGGRALHRNTDEAQRKR